MKKYEIVFGRTEYYVAEVEAKSKREAIEKGFEGDTIKTFTDPFILPPEDWKVSSIEEIKNEEVDRDYPFKAK